MCANVCLSTCVLQCVCVSVEDSLSTVIILFWGVTKWSFALCTRTTKSAVKSDSIRYSDESSIGDQKHLCPCLWLLRMLENRDWKC